MSTVEALKKLDNARLELRALQVKNTRLWESNPKVSAELDRECNEIEELRQSLHDACEWEIQVQQDKRILDGGVGVC